jgi:hypothetical protein
MSSGKILRCVSGGGPASVACGAVIAQRGGSSPTGLCQAGSLERNVNPLVFQPWSIRCGWPRRTIVSRSRARHDVCVDRPGRGNQGSGPSTEGQAGQSLNAAMEAGEGGTRGGLTVGANGLPIATGSPLDNDHTVVLATARAAAPLISPSAGLRGRNTAARLGSGRAGRARDGL